MNFAALNAKIHAMGSKPLGESVTISHAAANICLYISCKPHKDYVMAMALAATHGGNLHYYTTQWKRLNRLDKANCIALRGALGAEIDITNILWMYRLKRYHRTKGDATFGYLIPIRYRLGHEITRRMADCVTPKALLDEAVNSPYSADFKQFAKDDCDAWAENETPEQILSKAIYERYRSAARRHPNTLAQALAYLKSLSNTPDYE